MSLAARIRRIPVAFDPAAAADARAALPGLAVEVRDLCAAAAGCSPYLRGLMQREAEWLEALSDPEAALEAALVAAGEEAADALPLALRQAKRRVALLSALCDLGGVWSLEAVTGP